MQVWDSPTDGETLFAWHKLRRTHASLVGCRNSKLVMAEWPLVHLTELCLCKKSKLDSGGKYAFYSSMRMQTLLESLRPRTSAVQAAAAAARAPPRKCEGMRRVLT